MHEKTYIVATIRPWNLKSFHEKLKQFPGNWHLVSEPEELTLEMVQSVKPRYIFFPHWSHKVSGEMLKAAECVCFHETDLPYGRGGSPVQNLVANGHKQTIISALRMVEELDAGPVYIKRPLSLKGIAEEIFIRAAGIVAEMIEQIVKEEPTPIPQKGTPTVFKRRKPGQSDIQTSVTTIDELFDHIRMLDAEEYPLAYLDIGGFRYEFSRPALRTGHIQADVKIFHKRSRQEEIKK